MTLDLLALLLPYLPSSEASALFESCLSKELLESKDNAVQKRAYKILAKLMEAGKVSIDAQSVLQQLDGFLDGLSAAAKKVCFTLAYPLRTFLKITPSGSFHSSQSTCRPDSAHQLASHSLDYT